MNTDINTKKLSNNEELVFCKLNPLLMPHCHNIRCRNDQYVILSSVTQVLKTYMYVTY